MTDIDTPLNKPDFLRVEADADALSRAAVQEIARCAQDAISARGRFTLVLSGGNTPRAIYSRLAAEKKDSLPWSKVFLFFGDERHVPPDDPDSNYRMAKESLVSQVPIPPDHVHRIQAELDADTAAEKYQQEVSTFFGLNPPALPRFDLVLLGMGDDGHTASLFPGTKALTERVRIVTANDVPKLNTQRITLTYPVFNNAAEVMVLLSGSGKAETLAQVLRSGDAARFPILGVRPEQGRLLWLADSAAARLL
jgi:6-phosphogluconolactonase